MSRRGSFERREAQKPTLHHRKPVEIGGARHHQRNHSFIPLNKHQAWHMLFGIIEAPEICCLINEAYLDPDYEFICVRKEDLHGSHKKRL